MASYGETSGSTDAVTLISWDLLVVGLTVLVSFLSAVWFLSTNHFDGRDGKRTKRLDIGGGSGPTDVCDAHQAPGSGQAFECPSSSGHATGTASGSFMLDHYGGSVQNEQHFRSLEVDGVKHKIFLSHSGAQKDFVEQLCEDLERGGSIAPFFDQRHHSLPEGKDFAPLIKEAARNCHVAVIVLSKEFLCSKWPMIELAEFHGAQQAGNERLNMLPLFYKLSVEDLQERAIEERWMPIWRELASSDVRIDVGKWSNAVRGLRKVNGLVFGKKGLSEVGYRKDIVRSIWKLSPPELLYGSSRSMVGYSRICEVVSDRFVSGTSGGPSFLGLYGTSGTGKTTVSKALCDYFWGEYMGRVCHVDLGETSGMSMARHVGLNETLRLRCVQLERVKCMLARLCGLDKVTLDRIRDWREGLMLMHMHMKRERVFLAMDNVTNDSITWKEAHEYLMAGFHPESRIVITSRSRSNVWDLVPDIEFCVPMPKLSVTEAGELFLRSAAPSKSIFGLSVEERRIVGLCILQCLLDDSDGDELLCDSGGDEAGFVVEGDLSCGGWKSFHPVALSALGDFFRRYFSNAGILRWRDHLKENKDPLWDLWKVPNGIGEIIGLQFHSLPPSEQLLFLDIACMTYKFMRYCVSDWHLHRHRRHRLCNLHNETWGGMMIRLQELDRSGMIQLTGTMDFATFEVAHGIHKRFAEWYMSNHGVKGLKNTWCVFHTRLSTLNEDPVASDLVRLTMFDLTLTSSRLLTIRELHNLEVLRLQNCDCSSELNLEGLDSLQHLELVRVRGLVAVTLSGSADTRKSGGIFKSLQYVVLQNLASLVHGPDVRLCTSLLEYHVRECRRMTNFDEMECPHLKVLDLDWLCADQLKRLANATVLHVLEYFYLSSECYIALSDVEASRKVGLRDLGRPYWRVVEELFAYLRTEWVPDDRESGTCFYLCFYKSVFNFDDLVIHDSMKSNNYWY